jgi:membrane AbrB-like protein
LIRWATLAAATVAVGFAADAAGIASPALFAALVVGLVAAVAGHVHAEVPRPLALAAQAVVGVALGLLMRASTLTAVGSSWFAVLGVSFATLALTVAAGALLARHEAVDTPTAALGMVAGGASGIVAMAGELGADDRLVAVMQYLRVLVIVLLSPVLVPLIFGVGHPTAASGGDHGDALVGAALAVGLGAVGALAGRAVRLPAGSLLGPLLLAAGLTLTGVTDGVQVPGVVQDLAFAVIGLQVGLRFTPEALRRAGRLVLPTLVAIVGLVAACAVLAVPLAAAADVKYLDAYLATTPGGLYAVLATAVGIGANTTFVLAVQILRLFVMLLAAPPLVRVMVARR